MLMKKFKREKSMAQALQDKQAMRLYEDEKRAEKYEQARIRREIADNNLAKKKLAEFKQSSLKQDRVDQRRNVGLSLRPSLRNGTEMAMRSSQIVDTKGMSYVPS